ncbi:MAG: phospholipase [Muribaculaceae bacterium]|nr:phospholipase [Muribaculaceae bacterium]
MMRRILILLIIACCAIAANAQDYKAYKGKVANGYDFWLVSPRPDTAGSAKKPIVVFLHGASLCGNNLNKVLRYGTVDAIKRGLKLDAYVIAPQTQGAWNPQRVMNVVDYVIDNKLDVDTSRIYVVGMSLGGYGSIDVSNAYPDRIAAALSFCGGGSAKDYTGLSQMPMWIVHGTGDRAVSVAQSDAVAAAVRAIDGSRLHYDRIPGMNHSKPARFFYVPEFYEWLFKHSLDDPDRTMAPTFKITDALVSNAYTKLRGHQTLITAPQTEREAPQGITFEDILQSLDDPSILYSDPESPDFDDDNESNPNAAH